MATPSLKSRNLKYIAAVLTADVAAMPLIWSGLMSGVDVLTRVALAGTGTLVLALLLTWLVPPGVKATLVYWRLKEVLPGHRAFSAYIQRDDRIDVARLTASLGVIPAAPAEQNKVWYRLLKAHEGAPEISEAHQRFLFFRDVASFSALLGVAVPTLGFLLWDVSAIGVGAFFAMQYLLFVLAARNAGIRLVQNVLALASSK
jgi:hypothetical protein